jgi:hypothetical protein
VIGSAADGFGWLFEKHARLVCECGFTESEAWHMDGAKGWAYYHWARAHQATVWGTGERVKLGGYVRQETLKIMAKRKAKEKLNG